MKSCIVCNASMSRAFSATVLGKHSVAYYSCNECGFLQTEEPYWLDEAYADAIAAADTGLVQRNFSIAAKLASVIYFCFEPKGAYLDLAGGYGMLTRLMRDIGFDFYWDDKYCQNLLARGFEAARTDRRFTALTAIEVMEHIHDPVTFVAEALKAHGVRTMIFTTQTFSGDRPPPTDWWYYAFETGQHISFYQPRTLARIAQRLRLEVVSANGMHMFSDRSVSRARFKLLTGIMAYPVAACARLKLGSKAVTDHALMLQAASRQQGQA